MEYQQVNNMWQDLKYEEE